MGIGGVKGSGASLQHQIRGSEGLSKSDTLRVSEPNGHKKSADLTNSPSSDSESLITAKKVQKNASLQNLISGPLRASEISETVNDADDNDDPV
jgi:hypothetical protein